MNRIFLISATFSKHALQWQPRFDDNGSDQCFSMSRFVDEIIPDKGSAFISNAFKKFGKLEFTSAVTIALLYPQANSQAKRTL